MQLPNHLEHGYEDKQMFRQAIRRIVDRWGGRTGEAVGERHGFLQLRFHDTPGGIPDEEWLPGYLLKPAHAPERQLERRPCDELEAELDDAYGFDHA